MTTVEKKKRDYSLVGESTRMAIETGLASAEWYHTEVSRKVMKELMQRSDGPAIRDTIVWLGVLLVSAAGAIAFWGTWWCVPFSSFTASSTPRRATRAGMNVATARRFARAG